MLIRCSKLRPLTRAGHAGWLRSFSFWVMAWAGYRESRRLMKRLGMPVSDDTNLRRLKRCATARGATTTVRIAGIDDWSWRKGCTYGTIVVDSERREVVDVLPDRSAPGTAEWLSRHPEVEIISRDRCGLYAQGAREGAPQARQVADRFHLLQNLRETIETQLSGATDQRAEPCCRNPRTKA